MAGASLFAGCSSDKAAEALNTAEKAALIRKKLGEMAYRLNKRNQDKVSLLGYGCMRFPTLTNGAKAGEIDEEMGQRLIDTAYAGGVNYYDYSGSTSITITDGSLSSPLLLAIVQILS